MVRRCRGREKPRSPAGEKPRSYDGGLATFPIFSMNEPSRARALVRCASGLAPPSTVRKPLVAIDPSSGYDLARRVARRFRDNVGLARHNASDAPVHPHRRRSSANSCGTAKLRCNSIASGKFRNNAKILETRCHQQVYRVLRVGLRHRGGAISIAESRVKRLSFPARLRAKSPAARRAAAH